MAVYQANKRIQMVFDMQFGSTGKGLLIGKLCEDAKPGTIAVSAMAPNAGHTFVSENGVEFVHSVLPLGLIFPNVRVGALGPGSTIDMDKMRKEMMFMDTHDIFGCGNQTIIIHEHASILSEGDIKEDSEYISIGSTMKGAGSAQISKIKRNDTKSSLAKDYKWHLTFEDFGRFRVKVVTHMEWLEALSLKNDIIIEGSQGYSLGLTSGMWPYTTYRECTPAQILSDCAVPCRLDEIETYGVLRTFPIRVANRYDDEGTMVGYSGPGYSDQKELTWEGIGVDPEFTTVTKLQRRVFDFSHKQFKAALMHTHPDVIFINFMNYLQLGEDNLDHLSEKDFMFGIGDSLSEVEQTPGILLGYGPKTSDIKIGYSGAIRRTPEAGTEAAPYRRT